MLVSTIKGVLSPQALSNLHALCREAPYTDGLVSGGSSQDKRNLELNPESEAYLSAIKLVELAIRDNLEFNLTAFPRYMTRPIISRYEVGMFFNDHVDFPLMNFMIGGRPAHKGLAPLGHNYVRSDLSVTLFISDPKSYEGGELCFDAPCGKSVVKLDAGSAVVYPTGTRHRVMPITRGIRMAAVLWVQSMFPVEAKRKLICDALSLLRMLQAGRPDAAETRLAEETFYNLFRTLAEV